MTRWRKPELRRTTIVLLVMLAVAVVAALANYGPVQQYLATFLDDTTYLGEKLTPDDTMSFRATLEYCKRVASANAFWMEQGRTFTFRNGEIPQDKLLQVVKTNNEGYLKMPPVDLARHALGIVGAHGGNVTDPTYLYPSAPVYLIKWSSLAVTLPEVMLAHAVHGVRLMQSREVAGVDVMFDYTVEKPEAGVFHVERLFPGSYWVGPVYAGRGSGRKLNPQPWIKLRVHPGHDAAITLTSGRIVTAQLEMPEQAWEWHREEPAIVCFQQEYPPVEFRHSYIYFEITPDGKATSPPLTPRNYLIDFASVRDPHRAADDDSPTFVMQDVHFNVPPGPEDTPIDIGTLTFRAQ